MKQITEACGCCEGIEIVTPQPTANRPGLTALSYRVGTHATFLETMLARLSSSDYPKLAELKTRESDDPSIALLDAWAIVADVLTFYNERIVNEGYLRTATERRSILELARLVGYKLRPGVASSVYLAYTIDDNFKEEATIPKGTRSQSIPNPGELPQSFETSEDLKARAKWNNLKPRMTRPQTIFSILLDPKGPRVYLKGINTNLKPNDPLLIDFGVNDNLQFYRVKEVTPDPVTDRSLIRLLTISRELEITTEPTGTNGGNSLDPNDPLGIFEQNDGVENILLDADDGVLGFFNLRSINESGLLFQLVSFQDGSIWSMEFEQVLVNQVVEGFNIKLNKNTEELLYKVQSIEVIEFGGTESSQFQYFRISLESVKEYSHLFNTLALPPSLQPLNDLRLQKNLIEQFSGSTFILNQEVIKKTPAGVFSSVLTEGSSTASSFQKSFFLDQKKSTRLQGLNIVAEGSNAIAKNMTPLLSENLANANANANVTSTNPITVYALRTKAAPFGHNAPARQTGFNDANKVYKLDEWEINDPLNEKVSGNKEPKITAKNFHTPSKLYLDAEYEILPNSWVVIENTISQSITPIWLNNDNRIQNGALAAYGISGKTTLLNFAQDTWYTEGDNYFNVVRNSRIYIQCEKLELAEESLLAPVCGGTEDLIELEGYYEDLQAGKWVVVSGERADTLGTTGVRSNELVMISVVKQDVNHQLWEGRTDIAEFSLPGDRVHTFIKLANNLEYCFKRDTVKINGNVVKATNGETRRETLGSGDGAKALQSFVLKQPPLTFVSASNPSGVDSTLSVFVNDVEWHETETLSTLSPTDRKFITKTDDRGKTTVVFGNGREGARLPTGIENIKSEYRNGIGKAGNVKAEQISLLASRPLGVKEVINPLRASGGADKENRDQARKNAPLAVKALDRLVSVQDYEDFARTYAGIGKASAAELSDGRRQLVHVTVAGSEDIPIDKNADLYRNLRQSLLDFGDPYQALQLEIRELMFVVISANLRILPDYLWESVVTQVRMTLLDAFSFERRELGQDVLLSEVLSVVQAVRGVAYVDVDAFGGIPEKKLLDGKRQLLTPAEIAKVVQDFVSIQDNLPNARLKVNLADFEQEAKSLIHPAQLAFLTPDVPETLILNQII